VNKKLKTQAPNKAVHFGTNTRTRWKVKIASISSSHYVFLSFFFLFFGSDAPKQVPNLLGSHRLIFGEFSPFFWKCNLIGFERIVKFVGQQKWYDQGSLLLQLKPYPLYKCCNCRLLFSFSILWNFIESCCTFRVLLGLSSLAKNNFRLMKI